MPFLDINFLKQLKCDYKAYSHFIESGTGDGKSIFTVCNEFKKVDTIEISEKYYNLSKKTYTGNIITFHLGDSHKIFKILLPKITENTIFYLDGHYSSGDTGRGEKDCPILEEISEINSLFKHDGVIIIDNYRLFGKNKSNGLNEDWKDITKDRIIDILKNRITNVYHLDSKFVANDRLIIDIRKQYQHIQTNHFNGVICFSYGGLGNQLFQAVAGYIVNRLKKIDIYILKNTDCKHNVHKLNYYNILLKDFGKEIEITHANFLQFINKNFDILSPKTPFSNWNVELADKGTVLCGFYQYYPTIAPFEKDIRNILIKNLDSYRKTLLGKYDFTNRIFIHVRRGDYINNKYHTHNGVEYYKTAYNAFDKSINYKAFLISDDIEYFKTEEFFKSDNFEVFKGNEIETLALMSLCTSGAICANSTFSWWGAFLGAYETRQLVVAPKKWSKDIATNLIPKEWILI